MPADETFRSGRPPSIRRKRPSAIGLRQTFPVQTNNTVFCGLKVRETAMPAQADQGQTGRNTDRGLRIAKYLLRQGSEGTHERTSLIEKRGRYASSSGDCLAEPTIPRNLKIRSEVNVERVHKPQSPSRRLSRRLIKPRIDANGREYGICREGLRTQAA
jgi:hypothetical protein